MEQEARKSQLGRILKELRLIRGLSGRELSRRSGIPQSHISKFENGKLSPSPDHLKLISDALELTAHERNKLQSWQKLLAHDFSPFLSSRQVAEGQSIVAQIEAGTSYIRNYQMTLVPGLLQTKDYMQALFNTEQFSSRGTSAVDIHRAISGRIERQSALSRSDKKFSFVLHESALKSFVASASVMKSQIEKIIEAVRKGSHLIGLLPFGRVWRNELPHSSFSLYDEDLALIELYGGVLYLYMRETVELYSRFYDKLQGNALHGTECIKELTRISGELEKST